MQRICKHLLLSSFSQNSPFWNSSYSASIPFWNNRAIQTHSEAGRYLLSVQHVLCHSGPFLIFTEGTNVADIKFLSENNNYLSWDLWKWQQLCISSWHVLWPQVTGLPFKKLFSKMKSFSPVACCPLPYFKVRLCTTRRPKSSSTHFLIMGIKSCHFPWASAAKFAF